MPVVMGSIFLAALLGVGLDCLFGYTQAYETNVIDKVYHEPWTELQSSTDADGNITYRTVHHPAEYRLICRDITSGKTFNCEASSGQYHSKTNGQYATVKTRQGRLTRVQWFPHIID